VYAMTIHKTQGSEFDEVALVLPDHQSQLLSRELIYTGLTRAKKRFSCLGTAAVWRAGVTARVDRWAGLAARLQG
jgi:exodeoxyribonuclease V alpha subunit